jgi:hypothetical protein
MKKNDANLPEEEETELKRHAFKAKPIPKISIPGVQE